MSRSHAEIRADLEHPHTAALLAVRASVGDAPIGRLLRDVGPLVDALAAVERERDQLREAWNDAAERANKASARADAALARIAAIEAERDEALATIAEWGDYAENLSEMRARIAAVEALIGDCAGHLHIPAEVRACPYCRIRASLAASPTPTGPKPTWLTTDCGRCDNERRAKLPWPERLSQRMILCPDCGSKRCPRAAFHGNACDRDIGPATPEPTEETP